MITNITAEGSFIYLLQNMMPQNIPKPSFNYLGPDHSSAVSEVWA